MASRQALGALIIVGLGCEALWLGIGTLTAWLTEVPAITAAVAPAQHVPWAWLYGATEAWLGADRTLPLAGPPSARTDVAFVSALGLAGAVYLLLLWLLARRGVSGRLATVLVFGLAWLLAGTMCWSPGLLSSDVVVYATVGRLGAVQHLNPYLAAAAWPAIDPPDATWWWYMPTPYAPAWTDLSAVLAGLAAGLDPLGQVLTFRALAGLALAASTVLIWHLVPRLWPGCSPRARRLAVAIFGWHPLVILETGQGHNDIVMAMLVLVALLPLVGRPRPRQGAWLASFAVLALAGLIKYLPGLPGLFVGALCLRQRPNLASRLRAATGLAGLGVGLAVLAAWPWLDAPLAVLSAPLNTPANGQHFANWVVDIPTFGLVARYLDKSGEHLAASLAQVRLWDELLVWGLLAICLGWELRRLWRVPPDDDWPAPLRAALGAALRALLLVVVFGLTQTMDYYFITPLALAAVLGWRDRWTRVCLATSLLFLPTFYVRRMELEPVPNALLLGSLLGPLVVGALLARRRAGLDP